MPQKPITTVPIGKVSIRKRGKTWHIRYRPYKGAKTIEQSLNVTNREAAVRKAQEIDHMVQHGEYGLLEERKRGEKITFADMTVQFKHDYTRWSDSTRRGAEGLIKILCAEWGDRPLQTITPRMIRAYLAQRMGSDSMSKSTHNRYLSFLRRLFRMAVDYGYLSQNPAQTVTFTKEEQKVPDALTDEQAEKLISVVPDYAQPLIIMALDTGLRRSELFRLTWDDIDFAEGRIQVRSNYSFKTGDFRVVYMTPRLRSLLAALASAKTGPNVLRKMDIKKTLYNAGDQIGFPGLHLHVLRHTCATKLLSRGIPLDQIQQWLGHKSIVTTQRYAKTRPDALKGAAAALAD